MSGNVPPLLRHYKEGEYHKEYDRRLTLVSMTTFLKDPTGDLPWDEDDNGKDVNHVSDMAVCYTLNYPFVRFYSWKTLDFRYFITPNQNFQIF